MEGEEQEKYKGELQILYRSRFEASVKVQAPSIPKSSSCAVLNFVHIARQESYVGCPHRRLIRH